MRTYYTAEKNIQILISLLKQKGIKRVIASPGMTNVSFVASIQQDPFFEIFSCVDERSAAYMACGMAAETKEPVVISCTGATASRNYVPGLTEAYYRHLPILAVTSSQPSSRIGHNYPQVTNRSDPMPDIVRTSVELCRVDTKEDEWDCIIKANKALLELKHRDGGPAHINLITTYNKDFSVKELPKYRSIERYQTGDRTPIVSAPKVGIFVGSHIDWSTDLIEEVDKFCENYNAVVLCDCTSNYHGKYRVFGNIVANQRLLKADCVSIPLLIHIGNISGAYMQIAPQKVWRVSPDGEVCDTFHKLTSVFEMREIDFFHKYNRIAERENKAANTVYFQEWKDNYNRIIAKIGDFKFSDAWIAQYTHDKLPENCELHLGILNSLRCWNYFELPNEITAFSNVGGFGIDGCVSSMIGASLVNTDKLYLAVVGDLAFFYDLNVLGNRHVQNNVRILLVNNGKGFEFKHYACYPSTAGIENVDNYIAAGGHFGKQSESVVKGIATNWGFNYYSASSKEEYIDNISSFLSYDPNGKPAVFEVFTHTDDESDAQYYLDSLDTNAKGSTKELIKDIIGKDNVAKIKRIMKK